MRTIAIMQPYFFPYLGYFQLIASVDAFLPYDRVSFRRKSFLTRNHLVTPQGSPAPIALAVRRAPLGSPIRAITLAGEEEKRRLDKQVQTLYGRAPHFGPVYEALRPLLLHPAPTLGAYNIAGLEGLCRLLRLSTAFWGPDAHGACWDEVEASLAQAPPEDGDRASHRVLRLCRRYGARRYLNPPGGRALYAPKLFSAHGVELAFLEPQLEGHRGEAPRPLKQASILDVLMVNGIEQTRALVMAAVPSSSPEPAPGALRGAPTDP